MKKRMLIAMLGLGLTVGLHAGWVSAEESTMAEPVVTESAASVASEPAVSVKLTVDEVVMATGVENRTPVGAGEAFPADVQKIYCFTKISGGVAGSKIVHKWIKGAEVISEVTLPVNGSPWRTYSSKMIMPEWTGEWSVSIEQDGEVLATKKFMIEAGAAPAPESAAPASPVVDPQTAPAAE